MKNNHQNYINHLSNIEMFGVMTQPAKISCELSGSESLPSSWQADLVCRQYRVFILIDKRNIFQIQLKAL